MYLHTYQWQVLGNNGSFILLMAKQRHTHLLLTRSPLEDWLLKTQHSTKNTHKNSSTKQLKIASQTIAIDNPSMKFHSVNTLGEGCFKIEY